MDTLTNPRSLIEYYEIFGKDAILITSQDKKEFVWRRLSECLPWRGDRGLGLRQETHRGTGEGFLAAYTSAKMSIGAEGKTAKPKPKWRGAASRQIEWVPVSDYPHGARMMAELSFDKGDTKIVLFATTGGNRIRTDDEGLSRWQWTWEVLERRAKRFKSMAIASGWARDQEGAQGCAESAFRRIAP